jgi:cytochrome b561/polyisoprenoid-binding protein YceI
MKDTKMPARNTATSYGTVARSLHWLTALLIIVNFPLGVIADDLPFDTSEALAFKAQLFSVHKTLGVAIFCVALFRILWALTGDKPVSLHPNRRVENFVADVVHWALYLSLVVVPLSGWVHHAAVEGFAPILWPLGQGLPFVPISETVAGIAATAHWLFTKVLLASVALHVLGALKHAIVDGDLTMARMTSGSIAGKPMGARQPIAPALVALAIFAAGGAGAWALARGAAEAPVAEAPTAAAPTETAGNWQVADGTLTLGVQQMGASVAGSLPVWTAAITFDEATGTGSVQVDIDTTQVILGSVSDQAKGPEFFDIATHPTARFTADITPAGEAFEAKGTLSLRGADVPVTLPFTLQITGDTATMAGNLTLDRRDFGMGPSYGDEKTVGFTVTVDVALTATRSN